MGGKDNKTNKASGKKIEQTLSDQPPESPNKSCSKKKPKLKVKVVQKGKASRVFGQAEVKVTGAEAANKKTKKKNGIANFGKRSVGKYHIKVTALNENDAKAFVAPEILVDETLGAGDDKTVTVEIEPINVVTPKIEMEYKVVLLERDLAQHQAVGETKLYADPTYVEVSLTQTNKADHPFKKGGKVKCAPANAEIFLDEACTNELDKDLTEVQLTGNQKLKLYLRGKTAGKFKISLELDDPGDKFIKLDKNPAEEEMAVVKLEMELYTDKKNHSKVFFDATVPTRTKLSEGDKISKGRIVQVQDGGKHARAKLVIKKPDGSLWTVGENNYKLTLRKSATSGDISVFKSATGGAAETLPLDMEKADLSGDATLWVQGAGATGKFRDVRLLLDLDRAPGGLAKTAKKNGDFASLTVVEFAKISPDAADYKQYINLPVDGGHPEYGRNFKSKAKLSKPLENVEIKFSLIPDAGNRTDLPNSLKHKKPEDGVAAVKTNNQGEAESGELKLSSFGGDKFKVAAYVVESPPHVEGAPAKNLSKDIEIWRKLFCKIACMKRDDGTSYDNRLDEAEFQSKLEDSFIEMERTGVVKTENFDSVIKDSEIATWNTATFGADVDRTLNIGLVEAQTGDATTDVDRSWDADTDYGVGTKTSTETLSGFTFDLSSQNEWLDSAEYRNTDVAPAAWHAVPDAKVSLSLDGLDHKLKIDLSDIVTNVLTVDKIKLKATVKKLDEWSGDKTGHTILIGMRWREQAGGNVRRSALQTTLHETGHFLGLAPTKLPTAAQGANPLQYSQNGSHCNYNVNQCTMYDTFVLVFDFCDNCGNSLKARDLSAPPVAATASY